MTTPRQLIPHQVRGFLVLELKGPVLNQYMQVEHLESEMIAASTAAPGNDVIVDMRHITMLTSVALLAFLGLRKFVSEQQGRVVLCNMADLIAKVFTVSQLIVEARENAHYLSMAKNIDAAIDSLEGPQEPQSDGPSE